MTMPPDIANNPVFGHMWNTVHVNKGNLIVLTNGLPRKGKSELDVNFAWNLWRDPVTFEHKFEPSKHCKWDKLGFQKIVQKYTDVGACLMWDEAGIAELGAHARQFWSESNIGISTLFQIMGFHRQIAFISLPMKMMLDKHLRLLSHIGIEAFKIKHAKNRCLATIKWLETSSDSNKIYAKYPRYYYNGQKYRIKTISVPRAPPEIRNEYIEYSNVFKQWLEKRLIRQEEHRQQFKDEGKPSRRDITNEKNTKINELIKKIKKNPAPYLDRRGDISANTVSLVEGTGYAMAKRVRLYFLDNKAGKPKRDK